MQYEICCEKLYDEVVEAMSDKIAEQMLHARYRDHYRYQYFRNNSIAKCSHCGADSPVVIKFD